jgi:hypothetical protein
MPDARCNKVNDRRFEVLIDSSVSAYLIQAETGLWHLSCIGSDEIEFDSTLTDGSVFSGGSFTDAFNAALVDYLSTGLSQ